MTVQTQNHRTSGSCLTHASVYPAFFLQLKSRGDDPARARRHDSAPVRVFEPVAAVADRALGARGSSRLGLTVC